MNKLLLLFCFSFCLAACSRAKKELKTHVFTCDTLHAHTPVLNQGRTSTCWAYASSSLLESDWLAGHPGDTVRLSPMYMVRQKYLKQFDAYYYSHGREEIRNGGLGHSFLRVLEEDGALPLSAYHGCPIGAKGHDHGALLKQLRRLAGEAVRHRDLPTYRKRAVDLLDRQMGRVPGTFLYKGQTYTPRSFADAMCLKADDYVQITSFTHHPFYTSFILEVPDNWEHQTYFNLPLDSLERKVRRALAEGRTVAWHGDVSEASFSSHQGMALWAQRPVTQEVRQSYWNRFETTDDHMMHIIGMAHDEDGCFYYLLKNSYGRRRPYGGLLYMSEDYFRAKTISVLMKK